MEITYIKIDNIKYKEFELYYKKEIDNIMTKATIFDSNYKYFYKSHDSIVVKPLGYFKHIGKKSSESRYYDFDYDIYQFDEDFVLCSKKDCIFCIEQPIYYENMVLIEDMFYLEYPVYYKNKLI